MTGNYSTREYREKLYDDLHVRLRDTVILMCAIFIASIGLNMNSTAVIIGAIFIWGSLSFLDQLCLYHANQHCWNKNYDEKISLKFI